MSLFRVSYVGYINMFCWWFVALRPSTVVSERHLWPLLGFLVLFRLVETSTVAAPERGQI